MRYFEKASSEEALTNLGKEYQITIPRAMTTFVKRSQSQGSARNGSARSRSQENVSRGQDIERKGVKRTSEYLVR